VEELEAVLAEPSAQPSPADVRVGQGARGAGRSRRRRAGKEHAELVDLGGVERHLLVGEAAELAEFHLDLKPSRGVGGASWPRSRWWRWPR
jgi:hypothetical protein